MATTAKLTPLIREVRPLLFVEDMDRSLKFYCDGLGFTIAGKAEDDGKIFWCSLQLGNSFLMIQQAEEEDGPAAGRGRGVILYFQCDDVDATHADFVARGLTLPPPTLAYYGMKQLYVRDPDGYDICFQSPA